MADFERGQRVPVFNNLNAIQGALENAAGTFDSTAKEEDEINERNNW